MNQDQHLNDKRGYWPSISRHFRKKWEAIFFVAAYLLLVLQVFFFVVEIRSLSHLHAAVAAFAAFESFVVHDLLYASLFAILLPVTYLLFCPGQPAWSRKYLDIVGGYIFARMIIQLIGLNILVFDSVSSRFLLITQLLFFLPYSLLIWGWLYWRLDAGSLGGGREMFHLDHEGETPRPIDYFVASFSSVFSASITGVKGKSARARILILAHGFLIFDVMGLTLSRAVALVQSR